MPDGEVPADLVERLSRLFPSTRDLRTALGSIQDMYTWDFARTAVTAIEKLNEPTPGVDLGQRRPVGVRHLLGVLSTGAQFSRTVVKDSTEVTRDHYDDFVGARFITPTRTRRDANGRIQHQELKRKTIGKGSLKSRKSLMLPLMRELVPNFDEIHEANGVGTHTAENIQVESLPTRAHFRALCALQSPFWLTLLATLAETLMEVTELLELKWEHIDFKRKRIRAGKSFQKSARNDREIPIFWCLPLLKGLQAERKAHPDDWVFVDVRGARQDKRTKTVKGWKTNGDDPYRRIVRGDVQQRLLRQLPTIQARFPNEPLLHLNATGLRDAMIVKRVAQFGEPWTCRILGYADLRPLERYRSAGYQEYIAALETANGLPVEPAPPLSLIEPWPCVRCYNVRLPPWQTQCRNCLEAERTGKAPPISPEAMTDRMTNLEAAVKDLAEAFMQEQEQ